MPLHLLKSPHYWLIFSSHFSLLLTAVGCINNRVPGKSYSLMFIDSARKVSAAQFLAYVLTRYSLHSS